MSRPIRLLIVDGHTLFRCGLAALLNRRRGLQVVGEAATGTEALTQGVLLQPDVVVLDLAIPEGGSALVTQLCRESPKCAVLVLTPSDQMTEARAVLQAGARGCIQKNCEPDELVRAIERVHAGELVVSRLAVEVLLEELSPERANPPGLARLTERELEVLHLVMRGLTNPAIARELCITEHTTKGHLGSILAKLELDNRVQLATYAMQHGLGSTTGPRRPTFSAPYSATAS